VDIPPPASAPNPGPKVTLGGTLQMDESPLTAAQRAAALEARANEGRASAPSVPMAPPAAPSSNAKGPAATKPEPAREPGMSDPELRSVIDNIGRQVGHRDPEQSLEIPPPARIEESDEEGDGKDPYIGTTFDHRYKIEELLGEGGMGFVYRARHKVIGKKVAIKVLRADLARDKEITDRFQQEARAASSIGNPHIIDISDFGDLPDGSTYFVMEFLDGRSLANLIDSKVPLTVERICHITAQIADGLAGAHSSGIVHRDLKPDNIYLVTRGSDKDFIKILDFGIAKVTGDATTKLTKAGAVFGTPHYMSPEQAAGAPIDHRTDIYSLGVIMYEMTSGQLPFNADNFMGILTQHMYKAPVPIRALVPVPDCPVAECPPTLEAVILKCMSKKPEQRYQSMEELREDLEKVRVGGVPGAVGEMMARSGGFNVPADYFKHPGTRTALVPATPPTQRKPWPRIVWVAGAVAAVGLVAGIFAIAQSTNGAQPEPTSTATTPVPPPTTASAPQPDPTVTQSAAPAGPKMITVLLDSDPSGTATIAGKSPLQLPDNILVEEGKTVSVKVERPGYEPAVVEIDGKKPKEMVKLVPRKGGTGTKPAGSGTGTSGPYVDPWASPTKGQKKR
jgi:serine/threonine protein kinase